MIKDIDIFHFCFDQSQVYRIYDDLEAKKINDQVRMIYWYCNEKGVSIQTVGDYLYDDGGEQVDLLEWSIVVVDGIHVPKQREVENYSNRNGTHLFDICIALSDYLHNAVGRFCALLMFDGILQLLRWVNRYLFFLMHYFLLVRQLFFFLGFSFPFICSCSCYETSLVAT